MQTVIKPELALKTSRNMKRTVLFLEKGSNSKTVIDFKFYQKLFIVLVSLSTILIFPESPKELETFCQIYHSKQNCNVW